MKSHYFVLLFASLITQLSFSMASQRQLPAIQIVAFKPRVQCALCGRSYTTKSNLDRHKRIKHAPAIVPAVIALMQAPPAQMFPFPQSNTPTHVG